MRVSGYLGAVCSRVGVPSMAFTSVKIMSICRYILWASTPTVDIMPLSSQILKFIGRVFLILDCWYFNYEG